MNEKVFYTVNDKEHCDENAALAEMLAANGVLFVGGEQGPFFHGPNEEAKPAEIWINCNDMFAWGCADAEPLPHDKIGEFYKAWKAGRSTHWACKSRNLQPPSTWGFQGIAPRGP